MYRFSVFKFCLPVLTSVLMANHSSGQSTVLYCQEKGVVEVNLEGETSYKKERFKLNVTPKAITFGTDFGFLPNVSIPFNKDLTLSDYSDPENWWIVNSTDHIVYRNGFLVVLQSYLDRALAVSAECDTF